ncbi:MAG: BBP7 family outer membrane beta-barrel protein [Pirellulales bacterium]
MKMKKILATILALGLSVQQATAQTGSHFSNASATRTLSDSGENNRYASASAPSAMDMSVLAPTAYSTHEPTTTEYFSGGDMSGYSVGSCGSSPSLWISAENLFVFAGKRNSPVLVTTAGNNVLPQQGNAGVTDAFGGRIDPDLLYGYRMSAGAYFGCQQKVGIGVRGYGIYDGSEVFSAASDGTTSIGVPFLNIAPGSGNQTVPGVVNVANDAYIVAGSIPAGLISTGSIVARDTIKMIGSDLSGHLLLARSGSFRTDLVAGWTYNQLRNRTTVNTTSVNQYTGDLIVNGTVLTTSDSFATDNKFNGAHLGVLSSVVRNQVSFQTLAKIAFGNMRSKVNIAGSSTIGGVPDTQGLFALPTNIGTTTNDHFAFLPELGMKLGYSIRPNVQVTVGYTLLVWSDVMLSGEQIDPVLNLSGAGPRPMPLNKHTTYWMQSVDAGLNFTF